MTIVLSVLLVVCLVAIGYLCVAWSRDAYKYESICNDVRDSLAKSKAECVGLSDQVAGLNRDLDTTCRIADRYLREIDNLKGYLEIRTRERDQWRYQLDQLLDPIVRLKMLEPPGPIYVVANQERLDELKREIESTPLPQGE